MEEVIELLQSIIVQVPPLHLVKTNQRKAVFYAF